MTVITVDTRYPNDKVKLIPLSERKVAVGVVSNGFPYVEVYLDREQARTLLKELGEVLWNT